MITMKKKVFLMALVGAALTACSNHDFETWTEGEKAQADYEAAFIKRFGQPDPNHTWGFSDFGKGAKGVKTRTADPRGNMWAGEGWNVPEVLTDAQKDIVRQYFQQNKNPEGIAINYTDFFVQDVYKGGTNLDGALTTEKYKEANGSEIVGSQKMDKLTAGSGEDHIGNYNNAHCSENNQVWDGTLSNANDPNSKNVHTDKIMLMVNSKTDCFGYHCSENNVQYNDRYVIISGDVIMSWARTNNKELNGADVSGMYFVGFDFEMLPTENNKVNLNQWLGKEVDKGTEGAIEVNGKWYIAGGADGYYSDWIVRVKPGKDTNPKPAPIGAVRVIAEDLTVSDKSDFDFNDVVFDVKLGYPAVGQTTIILQAAGGTLPLKVGGKEVHEIFEVQTNQMVNTGAGPEVAPKEFILNEAYTNAIDVPVQVQKNGEWINITAEPKKCAAKIAVSTSFKWCKERQDIENKYPDFRSYVGNANYTNWY